MEDYRNCLGYARGCGLSIGKHLSVPSGSSWHCEAGYGAGHPVVRAAGPQGANVRQAANSWARPGPKGGDYPAFQQELIYEQRKRALRAGCPAGRIRYFRRTVAPHGHGRRSFGVPSALDSRTTKIFHPAECFAGVCTPRLRRRLCEESRCRNGRTPSLNPGSPNEREP